MKQNEVGHWLWAGLATYVVVADVFAPETLTSACRRARNSENRLISTATYLAIGATVLHLLDKIPPKVDPFYTVPDLIVKGIPWNKNQNPNTQH